MSRFLRRWRAVLVVALAAVTFLTPHAVAQAAPDPATGKIDTALAAKLAKGSVSFLVHLKGEADLRAATAGATTKADKATRVFTAKTAHAETTQRTLRTLLTTRKAEFTPFWIVNTVKVTGDADLAADIAALPEVRRVELDRTIPAPKAAPGERMPKVNAVEWNIDRVGAPRVWSEYGTRGEGIVVANIDSGVQVDHPALAAQYRGRKADGTVDDNYNWFDVRRHCRTSSPCDLNGHGTHTMGIMVGDSIGVAPGAKWIAANACSWGCDWSALLEAGQWMVAPTDLNGRNPRPDLAPHIVNNSWSSLEFHTFYTQVVATWVSAGIFPVFSQGNAGPKCNTGGSPSADPNVYSVGAFDAGNRIAESSSRGVGDRGEIKPDGAAPGVNVRSSVPGSEYHVLSGTSMAAPHAAGIVALLWSAAPGLSRDIPGTRDMLARNAIDVDDTSCGGTAARNNVWGEGRLDANRLLSDAPTGPTGGLAGTVTSGGTPVAQAEITVTGPLNRTLVTGANGAFALPYLKTGTYQVAVRALGYGEATASITVAADQTHRHEVSLQALATHPVTGTATAEGGGPEAGAVVSVTGTSASTVTDAAGRYRLAMPVGDFELRVTPRRQSCAGPVSVPVAVRAATVQDITVPRRLDAFGYSCVSGREPYVAGTSKVTFASEFLGAPVELPFPIVHYGETYYGKAWVHGGGWLSFVGHGGGDENRPLPYPGEPNGSIMPFWDALKVDDSAGVYTATVGTAPKRFFVVEWRNVAFAADRSKRVSFSALIGEDSSISFRYRGVTHDMATAGGATIGIENGKGDGAFQYSFDTGSLTDGQSLTFSTDRHGFLSGTVTDANDGSPLAGATVKVGEVTTRTIDDGTYIAQVPVGDQQVTMSKENYGSLTQPATVSARAHAYLDAALITGKISASAPELDLVMPADATRTGTLVLTNTGTSRAAYSLQVPQSQEWLSVSPAAGELAPGASATVTVTARSTGLPAGAVRTERVLLRSASGRVPEMSIPVTMVIPRVRIALDAGSPRETVDSLGERWSADRAHTAGGSGYLAPRNRTRTTSRAIKDTADQELFRTARESMSEYRFDNLPVGFYTVELGFAETGWARPEQRVVDVYAEGEIAVPALDLAQEVGIRTATVRSYTVKVLDGQLNMRFTARKGRPILSSIRVSERPDKLTP
ncbi:S8 family serine peptidase [Sinosporangium siamense]|uniref:alpha-amylase n=1 Tax=Sinosporangium siamense TaxID=1367973 RepID=A0A919VA35_9ACTN|nr:S8 family serine peptidase [Sinosporangium siamense]GII94982.1 hypothetical protein Ssi02_52130 [Sinosporangium siamense]